MGRLHGDDGQAGPLQALGHKGKEWKERYFSIKDNFMHYFKKEGDQRPDGVIPLEGSTVSTVEKGGKVDCDNVFELIACSRSYLLRANSADETAEWVAAITQASKMTIRDLYDIKRELGAGTFATVKLGVLKRTGQAYAIKIIDKATLQENREALLTEISILKQVDHINVINMKEIFETRKKLYLIMDVLDGGELFDRIVENGTFSEKDASDLSRSIIGAIGYLHSLGIVHRDLKPENLLYTDRSPNAEIKIADFGLSKFITDGELLHTACGTPGYVAPEVLLLQGYGKQVDMWSVGVIVYILLCGFPPFYAENDAEMFEAIKAASYDFPSPYWDRISDSAKDLVRGLLQKNPDRRLTTEQALEHPWITGESASTEVNTVLIETLKEFNAKRRFQQGVGKLISINRFKNAMN
ncbi:Protein kinase, putative [Hondaea fermentalgiana]|uniref:non-specific serine/threonine protein kinase n=1 Tax=Hondaea fermentalgiana TaxID=2315210 RepID=A0A2R5GTF0_9STRA|nr:Protein kinase, putative [Hondaea fermentalgiana]|eukprot:GBG31164.1 Protein kinase, putative [Hondaea fermentalgiana]